MRTITTTTESYLYYLQIGNALWLGEACVVVLAGDTDGAGHDQAPVADSNVGSNAAA